MVYRHHALRCWWKVAQGAVGSDCVAVVQSSFDQDVLKTKLDQQMGALERGTLTACIGQRRIARRIKLSSSVLIGVKMSREPSATQSRKTAPWALTSDTQRAMAFLL